VFKDPGFGHPPDRVRTKEASMEERALDARELIERVKAENRAARWMPLPPSDLPASRTPMREEESLYYLHRHWILPDRPDPADSGAGIKGRVVHLFGRLTFAVLAPYLRQERELVARMVRMNDALARRYDDLAQAMVQRQLDEAENDAKLAAWLNRALPEGSADPDVEG
jgi:hypothetical protein